jgi:hypothetical protein
MMKPVVAPFLKTTMLDPLAPEVPAVVAIIITITITNDYSMFKAPTNDRWRHTYWNCGHKYRRAGTGDGYSHRKTVCARRYGRRTDSNRNQTE